MTVIILRRPCAVADEGVPSTSFNNITSQNTRLNPGMGQLDSQNNHHIVCCCQNN